MKHAADERSKTARIQMISTFASSDYCAAHSLAQLSPTDIAGHYSLPITSSTSRNSHADTHSTAQQE